LVNVPWHIYCEDDGGNACPMALVQVYQRMHVGPFGFNWYLFSVQCDAGGKTTLSLDSNTNYHLGASATNAAGKSISGGYDGKPAGTTYIRLHG
jgi:hypothetical protein